VNPKLGGLSPLWGHKGPDPRTEAGLSPDFRLHEALADFYLLERLETDLVPGARERMERITQRTAHEFAIYLSLACGGELRHLLDMLARECRSCAGYGLVSCGGCYGTGATACTRPHHSDECELNPAGVYIVMCEGCEGDGQWECGECSGFGTLNASGIADFAPSELADFFASLGPSDGRTWAWKEWVAFREKNGPEATRWMARAFRSDVWRGGYGGEAWYQAARLLYDYETDKISARVFVNMAWSLQHNTGIIFDKAYDVGGLEKLLERQARGDYDRLARHASPQVATEWRLWESKDAPTIARRILRDRRMLADHVYMTASQRRAAGMWDGD